RGTRGRLRPRGGPRPWGPFSQNTRKGWALPPGGAPPGAAPPPPHPPVPSPHTAGTVADIMRPPVTTPRQNDHAAAAAYLMKHAGTSALLVLDAQDDRPIGIITEADITRAVADRKDLNEVRIRQLMTTGPAVIGPMTT